MWQIPIPDSPDPGSVEQFRIWFAGLLRHSGATTLVFVASVLALELDEWLPFIYSEYWMCFVLACAAAPPARFFWNHRGRSGAACVSRGERAFRFLLACLSVGGVPLYAWWCLDMLPLADGPRGWAELALFSSWGLWLAGPGARRMTQWVLAGGEPDE